MIFLPELNMSIPNSLIPLTAMIVLLTACQNRVQTAEKPSVTVSDNAVATTAPAVETNRQVDKWLGQWNGPEGTYLLLSKNDDRFVIIIQSLVGPKTYQGVSVEDHIQFERDGKTESIRAGNGEETGMKWLLGEKNCLIIKVGEGFCRK